MRERMEVGGDENVAGRARTKFIPHICWNYPALLALTLLLDANKSNDLVFHRVLNEIFTVDIVIIYHLGRFLTASFAC